MRRRLRWSRSAPTRSLLAVGRLCRRLGLGGRPETLRRPRCRVRTRCRGRVLMVAALLWVVLGLGLGLVLGLGLGLTTGIRVGVGLRVVAAVDAAGKGVRWGVATARRVRER